MGENSLREGHDFCSFKSLTTQDGPLVVINEVMTPAYRNNEGSFFGVWQVLFPFVDLPVADVKEASSAKSYAKFQQCPQAAPLQQRVRGKAAAIAQA